MYTIVFSEDAKKDLKELNKRSPQAVSKLSKLLDEVREHPRTGTGQVEQLKGNKKAYRVGDCVAIGNLRTVIWRAWAVSMKK